MGFVLGESQGKKPCIFPCKAAAPDDATVPRRVCGGSGPIILMLFDSGTVVVASICFGCVCVCARSFRVFWNLGLQLAVGWLHEMLPCCVAIDMRACIVMLQNAL